MKRFTIRSLLIATLVVALFLAFPFRSAQNQKSARAWVLSQKGMVIFQHDMDPVTGEHSIPWVPDAVVSLLGPDLFNPVQSVVFDCEEFNDFRPLESFSQLQSISINIELAEGIDFEPLKRLPKLKQIYFSKWSFLTKDQFDELTQLLPKVNIFSEKNFAAE